MAGRISELPALPTAEAVAVDDDFELRNVSDTSNNATGENVRVAMGGFVPPQLHLSLWTMGVR